LQKNGASKIDEYILLGVSVDQANVFKSYVIGFVDSSIDVDENCPHNIDNLGVAGKTEQIENVQEYFSNNVCLLEVVVKSMSLSVEFHFRKNLQQNGYSI